MTISNFDNVNLGLFRCFSNLQFEKTVTTDRNDTFAKSCERDAKPVRIHIRMFLK